VLHEAVTTASFATGDTLLDGMLEDARQKFLSPDESVRRDALKKLWDAFERIKTLEPGWDKAAQAKLLLDKTAGTGVPKFREMLELEALALTKIGNSFHIRHSERAGAALIEPSCGLPLPSPLRIHLDVGSRNAEKCDVHIGLCH
jgi:hypothetical protein